MNIESEKLKLIDWIANLRDDSIIERIKMLKENQSGVDWWDEITEEEKAAIEKGLEDVKAGRLVPHEKVKAEYAKRL